PLTMDESRKFQPALGVWTFCRAVPRRSAPTGGEMGKPRVSTLGASALSIPSPARAQWVSARKLLAKYQVINKFGRDYVDRLISAAQVFTLLMTNGHQKPD